MRLEGTLAPRINFGLGGLLTRCAQSRGEWPGARRTFFDGREEGGREDDVGARDREGGVRRVEAAEGGGRRLEEGFPGRRFTAFGGRDGGGIKLEDAVLDFCLAVEVGGGGGGGAMDGLTVCGPALGGSGTACGGISLLLAFRSEFDLSGESPSKSLLNITDGAPPL